MRLRRRIWLLWASLSFAVVVSGGAVAQERAAGDKAVVVERELATRFDAGRKWAVIIGVNEYIDQTIPSLRYCVADARLVADTLRQKCGYEADRILLLTDDQPKTHQRPLRLSLLERIPAWLERAAKGDTVLVYFSGHGFLDKDGQSYLAPQDCRKKQLALSAVRTDDLRNMLDQCAAAQKVLVLDCCHAGGVKAGEAPGPSAQQVAASFANAQGLITLASCAKEELSREWDAKRQGLFTYFLAEGLKGQADFDHNGLVDSDELYRYTMDRVLTTAQQDLNAKQTPVRYIPPSVKGVFALARVESNLPSPERKRQVTATFTVREQDEKGPTFAGARLEVMYRPGKEAEAVVLGRGSSDKDGAAQIAVWLDAKQQTEGEFLVVVSSASSADTWPMPGFPKSLNWSVYVASPGPAKPIANSIGMKLVLIPAGEFQMGSQESVEELVKVFAAYDATPEWFKGEHPAHRVRIAKPFYLGAYEVTVGQFRQFVRDTGYKTDAEKDGKGGNGLDLSTGKWEQKPEYKWQNPGFPQTDDHPVVIVSHSDAVAFCEWLSRKEGKTYRLPTEVQWEYACRAGTQTRYCNGDDPERLPEVGNVPDASVKERYPATKGPLISAKDGYAFTAPVGQFRPNGFGLYDMHGNVCEWCADWHDNSYYAQSPADDPTGPSSGTHRVLRGGAWYVSPSFARSAFRSGVSRGNQGNCGLGFRVARAPQ